MKLVLVIPTFNEERNILRVLREIEIYLKGPIGHFQVETVVVNDGSTDQTASLLEELQKTKDLIVIHHPINLGIGRAVQTGLKRAVQLGADYTVQLDGDGQHPISQLTKLLIPLLDGRSDVVVGSRYLKGSGGNVSSLIREMGTRFFSLLLHLLVDVKIIDTTSGYRAFNKKACFFLAHHYPDDYPEVQAYVSLARRHFRILEVPVNMRPREAGSRSSITPGRSLYYMLKVTFATVMERMREVNS